MQRWFRAIVHTAIRILRFNLIVDDSKLWFTTSKVKKKLERQVVRTSYFKKIDKQLNCLGHLDRRLDFLESSRPSISIGFRATSGSHQYETSELLISIYMHEN